MQLCNVLHHDFNCRIEFMNIIFVSTGKYPDQRAAAIRHTTIAQGVFENGNKVNFFLISPQEWECSERNYNGVHFTSLNNYSGNNKVLKKVHLYKALLKLKKRIYEINNQSKVDGIVAFSTNNLLFRLLFLIRNRKRIKIFHERTELPYLVGKTDSFLGKVRYNFYLKKIIPHFDGLFVISDKLKNFFLSYNKKIEKILTVVDTDFFTISSNPLYQFPYIAYCGKMWGNKDGVPILIQSFAKLLKQFPDLKLLLIGDNSNKKAIEETLKNIKRLKLKENVVFTGLVDRKEMPNLLGNAKLLVVSKPNNEQNSGNFPIKVGEYLSTGIPIVVTSVGEIPKFISDGESGFLAIPDSVESFYEKMFEALSNYDKALKIGLNGRELAKSIFDFKMQAKIMCDFIKEINKVNGN